MSGVQIIRTKDGGLKVECSKKFISELARRYRLVQKYRPIMQIALLKQVRQK